MTYLGVPVCSSLGPESRSLARAIATLSGPGQELPQSTVIAQRVLVQVGPRPYDLVLPLTEGSAHFQWH